jgi:hypothetical protein
MLDQKLLGQLDKAYEDGNQIILDQLWETVQLWNPS